MNDSPINKLIHTLQGQPIYEGDVLRGVHLYESALSDSDLSHITSYSTIDFLDLSYSSVTDEGIVMLARLHSLTSLYLAGTDVTGVRFDTLPCQLTILDLCDCSKIKERWLQSLGRLTNLEKLKLRRTAISDQSLAYLTQLQHLRLLAVDYTPVTDACVDTLLQLKNLRSLGCHGTRITASAVRMLVDRLPNFVPSITM